MLLSENMEGNHDLINLIMYGTRTDGTQLPPALSIILHQFDEDANFCCIIFKGIAKLVPKRRVWKPDGPLPLPFTNDSWMKTPPNTNGKLLEISTNNTISKEIKENTYKLVSSDTCIITYMTSFDATKTRIIEQKCIVNESKITPTWTIHNTFTNTELKLCHYKRFRTFYNILFCCHRLQFWQDGRGPTVLLWLSADTKSRSTTSKFIIMFCLPFLRRLKAHVRVRQP